VHVPPAQRSGGHLPARPVGQPGHLRWAHPSQRQNPRPHRAGSLRRLIWPTHTANTNATCATAFSLELHGFDPSRPLLQRPEKIATSES
jgi:hypothetical protein